MANKNILPPKSNLRRNINNVLTLLVIGVAVYLMAMPLWPAITWKLKPASNSAPYGSLGQDETDNQAAEPKPLPLDNRIVIPSAKIDQPIYEGSSLWVIEEGGTWRKNLNTSSPKDVGNTVIVGHRFTYKHPEGGFYHLDKVNVGDRLAVYWQGEELIYVVVSKSIVPPESIEVEYNTTDRRLTLYTCTPLVTAENRLVIIAEPEGV